MTSTLPADLPRRGRPRSEKARRAILEAAAELLLDQGIDDVSMDAVALRAGVSKATIYRWWPAKEALALDAIFHTWAQVGPDPAETGSLRGDLLALLRPWMRLVTVRPYARVIAGLVAKAQNSAEFAEEFRARLVEPRREQARTVLRRAVARRQMQPDLDLEVVLDLVYGPLYHRLLHGHAPFDERFLYDLVDIVVGAVTTTPTTANFTERAGT